ncbi:MAG: uncharacterized protein K0S04_2766 [Herbinix sp.]|nr:uncharacterized protein [Herbinix sp.]
MKSIKTKNMIFAFSLIMCAILALGITSYYRFRHILIQEVNNTISNIAQESSDHLRNYVDQFVSPLIDISENEDIKSMDIKKQMGVLNSQINPSYLETAIVDLKGIATYNDGETLDLSDRTYIIESLQGKISFSDVLISRKTNSPVIMIGVPIYRDSEVVGSIIARIDANFLQSYAFISGYGETGKAYVINDRGAFISRPTGDAHADEYNLYQIAKQDDKYKSFAEIVKQSQNQQTGTDTYLFDGKRYIMGYAAVDGVNWKIFISSSEDQVLIRLQGIRNTLITVMMIVIVLSIIVSAIYVNHSSKSLIELDHLFSEGAKGNLTIRFTPKSKDEFGRVGLNFNLMMDKMKTLMQYDPLTSLLNHYVLEKDVEELTGRDGEIDFALIMIAIDKFSFINETYGYNIGDQILHEAARRISTAIEKPYQSYRYKGDEFVILCKGTESETDMNLLAQSLLAKLRESYYYNDKTIEINVSIGTFHWNEELQTEEPMKAVTMAKNYAKYLGSNQVQDFEIQMYMELKVMSELQADIVSGIRQNQFFLVYQPLFNLENGQIAEAEALIRWRHPEKGLLYPDQFIEIAEVAGTILHIDHWVIESACKQLYLWKLNNKKPIMISVNISSKTFETKKFVPNFIDILNKYDVDPRLIQLELTERMVIKNVEESILKLKALRKMGIRIAIDDFGIGYSSLSYIVRLPIDCVKIDKSFVQNMATSKEAKSIVTTIINLCKTLNLNVVAEGIEDRFELEYLRANQCDIGQGYYFSKPVEIKEVEVKYMLG